MLAFLGKRLKTEREKGGMSHYIQPKRMQKEKKNNKGKASNMIPVTEIVETDPDKLVLTINANGLKYYCKRQRISNSI